MFAMMLADGCEQKMDNKTIKLPDGRLQCPLCPDTYKNTSSLYNHKRKMHGMAAKATVKCPADGCAHSAISTAALCSHLAEMHQFVPESIKDRFETMAEFEAWYKTYAAEKNIAFVRHRSDHSSSFRLYCNRSGNRDARQNTAGSSHTTTKKRAKSTSKIGTICPAYISCSMDDDGRVSMAGQLTHFGHELDMKYVPIPQVDREARIDLLREGHLIDDIPEIIRQSKNETMRSYFVEVKDVRQIADSIDSAAVDLSDIVQLEYEEEVASVDADNGDPDYVERSTLRDDDQFQLAWQSVDRQMMQSIDAVKAMMDRPIPASFSGKQRDAAIAEMKKAGAAMMSFKQNLQRALSDVGFGASRVGITMATQTRTQAGRTVQSTKSELVAFQQRKRKPPRDASEQRRALEAVKQQHLQVESGMQCGICKLAIEKAVDRVSCDVCEQYIHQQCRAVHAESCADKIVSFDKPTKKMGKRRRGSN